MPTFHVRVKVDAGTAMKVTGNANVTRGSKVAPVKSVMVIALAVTLVTTVQHNAIRYLHEVALNIFKAECQSRFSRQMSQHCF